MSLTERPRRLRATPALRRLVRQTRLTPAQLVWPLFVGEGLAEPQPLESLPGQFRHSLDSLAVATESAAGLGLGGVMLFGVPEVERRDAAGSQAVDPEGILNRGIARVRQAVGDDLVVMADTCLDEFTDHGHCGVLSDGVVDNDATVEVYVAQAIAQARAGAHFVSPSGMMDGQVAAIRQGLDAAGFTDTGILAYGAKYASAFYGPFREAVSSALVGDRRAYQQDPANRREGLREALLDIEQGADLTKDALRIVAAAAPAPVAQNDVFKALTDMGYKATEGTRDRLIEGLGLLDTVTDGELVRQARDTGRSAVYQMNATVARQILKALRP